MNLVGNTLQYLITHIFTVLSLQLFRGCTPSSPLLHSLSHATSDPHFVVLRHYPYWSNLNVYSVFTEMIRINHKIIQRGIRSVYVFGDCIRSKLMLIILRAEWFLCTGFSGETFECATRNSSGDEIANVNFLYDDILHALQNTVDSCINSAMHRLTRLEHRFTKFSEIMQCNGHYAIQGHSRALILVPIESSYTISYS